MAKGQRYLWSTQTPVAQGMWPEIKTGISKAIAEIRLKPGEMDDGAIPEGLSSFPGDREDGRIGGEVLVLMREQYKAYEGGRPNILNIQATKVTGGPTVSVACVCRSSGDEANEEDNLLEY